MLYPEVSTAYLIKNWHYCGSPELQYQYVDMIWYEPPYEEEICIHSFSLSLFLYFFNPVFSHKKLELTSSGQLAAADLFKENGKILSDYPLM